MQKILRQNATSFYDKGLGEIRDIRNLPKHNKNNIQEANSQYQTKQLDIGTKTDKWTNGVKSKTLILIHTLMNT